MLLWSCFAHASVMQAASVVQAASVMPTAGGQPNEDRRSADECFNPALDFNEGGAWDSAPYRVELPATRHVMAGMESQFTLQRLGTPPVRPGVCHYTYTNEPVTESLLIWFRAEHAVFSAPAIATTQADAAMGRLTVRFKPMDSGEYDLHVAYVNTTRTRAGNHGTTSSVVRVPGGPWRLWVHDQSNTSFFPPAARLHLPAEQCDGNFPHERGRWVRCSAMPVTHRHVPCLRDGWLWITEHCWYAAFNPASVLTARAGRPLWAVFLGGSVMRGSMHTLVDVVAGVRDWPGNNNSFRSDVFKASASDEPGKGTVTKCWGWFDFAVGGLRLSFQDFRWPAGPPGTSRPRWQPYIDRVERLIREGADAIVVEMSGHQAVQKSKIYSLANDQRDSGVRFLVEAMRAAPSWRGKLVLSPRKPYLGYPLDYTAGWSCADGPAAGMSNVQQLLAHLKSLNAPANVVVVDEQLMSWSFAFDSEAALDEGLPSQHWHYELRRIGNRKCRSTTARCTAGRHFLGAVAEMAASMELASIWARKHQGRVGTQNAKKLREAKITVCTDCPIKACCPWPPPKLSPTFQVSRGATTPWTAASAAPITSLESMRMKGCAEG